MLGRSVSIPATAAYLYEARYVDVYCTEEHVIDRDMLATLILTNILVNWKIMLWKI